MRETVKLMTKLDTIVFFNEAVSLSINNMGTKCGMNIGIAVNMIYHSKVN